MKNRDDDTYHLKSPADGALEGAFRNRERRRCSKADFAAGFIAALEWLGLYDRFCVDHFDLTRS